MTQHDSPEGMELLQDARLNKGTAFTEVERDRLKLRGLLPPAVCSQEVQMDRILENLRRKSNNIERYILLQALQARNERLFYRTVLEHIDEIMPLIYTPTVGQACKEFAHIFRQPRGFYVTANDRGKIRELLGNWPERNVRVIVVTDGERILGLGDLGANGMGIAIGKLSLYTASAGIYPDQCLPVMLDVGTNNKALHEDPLYLGSKSRRLTGKDYFNLVNEFMVATQEAFPEAMVHFEDFATPNAHRLLELYRHRFLCMNDDIQGTGGVVLAGVYASTRLSRLDFVDLRILLLGAGSASIGIANLMLAAFVDAGLSEQEARERLWLVDLNGLVIQARDDLTEQVRPYAQAHAPADFISAIRTLKPQVLIGATGSAGSFTEEAIRLIAEHSQRPCVFALSNPTANAECTAEQAYQWSDGRAIFASGSPFDPVEFEGQTLRPSQSNNVYVFPGIGLGALTAGATSITDSMFLAAAKTLAELVDDEALQAGSLYPQLKNVRQVSVAIANTVIDTACKEGLAQHHQKMDNIKPFLEEHLYQPAY